MDQKIKAMLSSHYFEGVLLLVFGVIMLFFPFRAFTVISVITGVILCILGALFSLGYVLHYKEKHTLELFAGLMCLALGLEFIIRTPNLERPMHVVLSITLIYSAILLFLQAYDLRNDRGRLFWVTVGFAGAAIVFAILMLINEENSLAFLRIKGLSMIVEGVASLFVIKTVHDFD